MSVWAELKRRKVIQVAVAYAIVGWLVAQVAVVVFPVLLVPDVVLRSIVVVLLLGFPVALVLAWAYEVRPDQHGEPGTGAATGAPGRAGATAFSFVAIAASFAIGAVAGFTIAEYSAAPPPAPDVSAKTPVPLTANPDSNSVFSAAISPDGNDLAYADSTGLHLRLIQTGETHPLALPADMNVELTEIDWMPDGDNLIFTGTRGGVSGLWQMSIFGGEPRLIGQRIWRASVSPDGSRIAYLFGRPAHAVGVMDADGSNARELVDAGGESVWELGWSPDSRWLAYGTTSTDLVGTRIDAVDIDNGQITTIVDDPALFQNWRGSLPFLWASDGRLIFARQNPPPGESTSNLWQVDVDVASAAITGPVMPLTNVTGYNLADLSIAADGSRLSFLLETNQSDVWVGRLANDNSRFLEERQLTTDGRNDGGGGWSKDGASLYFLSERGVRPSLFRISATGGEPESVPRASGSDDNVMPSPDGEWLLYWRIEGEERALVRQPIDGGPTEEILRGNSIYSRFDCPIDIAIGQDCILGEPGPDNRFIFKAFHPVYGIGRELLSVEDRPPFRTWTLSPDGERIALVHNDGPARIIELDDGSEREISREGWLLGEFVDWSADGRGLFMDGQPTSGFFRKGLVYTPLDSNEIHVLRTDPNQWHVLPSLSPDGQQLAFTLMIFAGNAWMVENP